MSSTPVSFTLEPGYRGFVAGVVNADYEQRAFIQVTRDGNQLTSATFEGQGTRVHMRDVFNNREYWSFGPFTFTATVNVTISANNGSGSWNVSKMVGPLAIEKQPEPDYPMKFLVATVISEDRADASHDDCTIQVLQYKGDSDPSAPRHEVGTTSSEMYMYRRCLFVKSRMYSEMKDPHHERPK
ncbi:hypothetical protein BV22DRAFT_1134233 [Leucogyrophana mollusca]|uniref:Uncharacterized protein n=1 Tax=Leucogyrophana mollusca TaxID=85980 RepID=A0ACB8B119_9AGAM|nr:hypothetical protein BV22DRAFT_1134233 [Leucogyrophana mollusca]